MEVDQQVDQSAGPEGFPQFCDLPEEIQRKVWKLGLPERGARYIFLSATVQILQAPPAICHVCQQSREVALGADEGGIYELEDGRRTWFCKDTDFFLWGGFNLGLGELAGVIQNIVIPRRMVVDYSQACETFEMLFADGDFTELKNIFINLENRFTTSSNMSFNHIERSHLFRSNTIVVPNLNWYDQTLAGIDATAPFLPDQFLASWREFREIAFDDYDVHEWKDFVGDIKYALMSTLARLSGILSEEEYDSFEAEALMHPSGLSWWDFLAHYSPEIWPTCLITSVTGRERVDGVVDADDLLTGTLNLSYGSTCVRGQIQRQIM
ncbi:hypothetical protein F5Y05DRAFT_408304 [Hypoxylon sp. FL0543]|nr:hypothetical protein F5Y05DRAFT_408304 [Hypoxylon sp. FL0543]